MSGDVYFPRRMHSMHIVLLKKTIPSSFGRPFAKRFALCCQTVVCLSVCLSVCLTVCLSITLVHCGQTVGWIKMPLGTEVGLGPGDFVLGGVPSPPPKKGTAPRIFGPCLLWPNGCMYLDTTWYGGRPRCRQHCVRWDPAPPHSMGHSPVIFG